MLFWSQLKWLITSTLSTACHCQLKCSSGEDLSGCSLPCFRHRQLTELKLQPALAEITCLNLPGIGCTQIYYFIPLCNLQCWCGKKWLGMAISEIGVAVCKVQLDEFGWCELVYTLYCYNSACMSLCTNVALLA